MTLKEFKKEIDPQINSLLQTKIDELHYDKDQVFLANIFRYLKQFIRDGKRIRPYIAYITYISFGGKNKKEILSLLVFLEIFHYFCLIHDDIMDNSEKRHGLATVHKKFGTSQAILLGDYLFFWAWEIITNSKFSFKESKEIYKLFSEMINSVFLGQALDVNLSKKINVSDEIILKKSLYKTAGYTFINPMLIGLALSGNSEKEDIKFCESLGINLGLAFQIQDDLLDITSDFRGNKKALSDMSEGIPTIFTNFVLENGSKNEKEILIKNFGKRIIKKNEVKNIFYKSGAIDNGIQIINSKLEEARELISQKNDSKYDVFLDLIELINVRKN